MRVAVQHLHRVVHPVNGVGVSSAPVVTTLDNDGNAAFVFKGASCAAGSSQQSVSDGWPTARSGGSAFDDAVRRNCIDDPAG